jgi:putative lipoic acid-binding regulatory protein
MSDQNMDDDSATKNDDNDEVPIIDPSTVKISDHSDLSNRFLYKVNALMGNYDPAATDTDNDSTDGNILNAIMTFPTTYAFNIVGKTNGDDTAADAYIAKVKDIVVSNSGNKEIEFVVKPRGKNFTKVTVEAYVESSSMITNIYEQLADVEETVMRF